ncbi:hypothetical protein PoB_001005400 [Plakobranchus ocellatus]|uniref:Transmembrane protein n=1 Tax=Plakobranchus ocellatus TaxID=259542 RepID=A0AAV3YKI8_9GAST|nr:hypothetical protein PoB_001005400 [Plakobranchus ocellatus]
MTTAQGRELHNFSVVFGAMKELSLQDYNTDKHEGLVVRSSDPVSLYVHTTLGDSMVVFPVDTYARAYEIPRLFHTQQDLNEDRAADESTNAETTASSQLQPSQTLSELQTNLSAALFIFSPYNTNITIVSSIDGSPWDLSHSYVSSPLSGSSPSSLPTTISSSQSSPSSSSSSFSSSSSSSMQTVIIIEAFQLHKFPLNSSLVYRLYSKEAFAVVIAQTADPFSQLDVLCRDARLTLLDFVPPVSTAGKTFYLAFYEAMQFLLFFSGQANTTLDVITDKESHKATADSSGSGLIHVTSTSAAWVSASSPVTVFVRMNVCNDSSRESHHNVREDKTASAFSTTSSPSLTFSSLSSSSPTSSSSSSPLSSSSSSTPSSSSSPMNAECAENGFFLPSVDSYMSCKGTRTKDSTAKCNCTCPSVFQRDLNPLSFLAAQGLNLSSQWTRPASSVYPLLVGELYDVSTSIARAVDFRDAFDIIVNTNLSFLVFRQDFLNLNFLPAGMSLISSGLPTVCEGIDALDSAFTQSPFLEAACNVTVTSEKAASEDLSCVCELMPGTSLTFRPGSSGFITSYSSGKISSVVLTNVHAGGGEILFWEKDKEDTTRPLIAVIVSLCVSIFAVVALISGYMLVEMVSRRKHVRNTKIRPFVS